jgi:phenylacetate-CoA ligase
MRVAYTRLKSLYLHSPLWVKKAYSCLPLRYRFGRGYREEKDLIARSDFFPQEKLRQLQEARLEKLIGGILPHVPFYRPYITRAVRLRPFECLSSLPLVDKATMGGDLESFMSEKAVKGSYYYTSTGGTTGKPFGFYIDNDAYGREWAFMISQWERVGYQAGHRKATFRGVVFKQGDLWQYNPVYHELQFSPFLLNEANLARMVDKIKEYRPLYLHGYPSAITVLAKFIERNGVQSFPQLRAIFGASENVYPGQRELIESVFKTRLFSWYGQSEKVILAGECEQAVEYHVFPQYGVTELIGDDGRVIEEPGKRGELVGTGFLNRVVPFVRYRTGDYAEYADKVCACGRHYRLLTSVEGRWLQEMMVGKTKALISITALNMHSDVFDQVHQFKFIQQEVGSAQLLVVPTDRFSGQDQDTILEAMRAKVGDELSIDVVLVAEIPPAKSGKSLFLEQRLDVSQYF